MLCLSHITWTMGVMEASVRELFLSSRRFRVLLPLLAAHKSSTTQASVTWVISTLMGRGFHEKHPDQATYVIRVLLFPVNSLQFLQQAAGMCDGVPEVFNAFVSNFTETYEQRLALTCPICQHWAQLLEDSQGQLTSSRAAGQHSSVWFDRSFWQMCYFIPLRWFIFLTRDFLWDSQVDSGLGTSSAPPPVPHRSATDRALTGSIALTLRPPSHGSSTLPLTHNQTGYNMRWNTEKLRTMLMISVAQSSHCSSCSPNNSFWQSWEIVSEVNQQKMQRWEHFII